MDETYQYEPDADPSLAICAPGLLYGSSLPVPVPRERSPLELVFLPLPNRGLEEHAAVQVPMTEWNLLWESAQLRADFFNEWSGLRKESTPDWLFRYPDRNIQFVPDSNDPAMTYEPLYAMMPRRILDAVGLPLIRRPLWPVSWSFGRRPPLDSMKRFEKALSLLLWPRLWPRSRMDVFSSSDPIRLLSHQASFWLPHAISVVFERAEEYACDDEDLTDEMRREMARVNALNADLGIQYRPTRFGGYLWQGEEEARGVVDEMVEIADRTGTLRALLDAVRSNRVEDDFSPYWSRERADFERALHHTRAKVKVSFVELPEREAIHSAYTQSVVAAEDEALEQIMFNDFLALLDTRNRQIVICMRRGMTKAAEISRELGYANHSPVTKRLRAIRQAARKFFLEDRSV